MLKLSACIEMMFPELPFNDRIAAVKEAGLEVFEFWGWQNKDLDAIKDLSQANDLLIAGCTLGSKKEDVLKDWQEGGLVLPEKRHAFMHMLHESIEVAHRMGIKTLIVTVGQEHMDLDRSFQHDSIVEGLRLGAPLAEKEGVTLVVEPLNVLVNHKGYYLYSSLEGFDIIRQVNSPNVKLLFDIYHQQVTEGNLIQNIREHIDLIGHFHAADVPGRHEPGTGEINYGNVMKAIKDSGYEGYIGLEYAPAADTIASLQEIMTIAGKL